MIFKKKCLLVVVLLCISCKSNSSSKNLNHDLIDLNENSNLLNCLMITFDEPQMSQFFHLDENKIDTLYVVNNLDLIKDQTFNYKLFHIKFVKKNIQLKLFTIELVNFYNKNNQFYLEYNYRQQGVNVKSKISSVQDKYKLMHLNIVER